MSGSASRSTSSATSPSCSPLAGSVRHSPGDCHSRCGRARGAKVTDSPSRAVPVRRHGGDGRVLRAGAACGPRPGGEGDFVRLAQVYGRHALVLDETGSVVESANGAWHENDLVQEIARRPAGRAWYLVADETLELAAGTPPSASGSRPPARSDGTVVAPDDLPSPCRPATCWPCTSRLRSRTRSAASPSIAKRACSTKRACRSTASTRRASTSAVSPRAATRAASRPRSCLGVAAESIAG